jgi:hypothetical protein
MGLLPTHRLFSSNPFPTSLLIHQLNDIVSPSFTDELSTCFAETHNSTQDSGEILKDKAEHQRVPLLKTN